MTDARIITAALTTAALGTPIIGRSAEQWRNDFAVAHFGKREDVDFSLFTSNAKSSKPVFEVHERELARREYQLTLMRRNNANKLSEVDSIRVGMFGKLLKDAAVELDAEAVEPQIDPAQETATVNA